MSAALAAPNRSAGSFPGGFRTPAPAHVVASATGRHPKPYTKGDVLHLSGHSIAWPLASGLTSALSCQQASHAHALAEALVVLRPFQAGGINEPVDILA